MIGARRWKGHFTRAWLFYWLLWGWEYIRKNFSTSWDGRIEPATP